jgi:glycosyltransferase involved in cell wall biosynthesis
MARTRECGTQQISGAAVPLTVLSVSYPLAQVSSRTAGGAEQILAILDNGLVEAGHRSLVLAPAGSRCRGLLIPAQVSGGTLDESAKRNAQGTFKKLLHRALGEFPVDIVHMHGLDFHEYLPERDVPVIVTLHLPLAWYKPQALRFVGPNVSFVCVSRSQAFTVPAGVQIDRVIPNGIELDTFARAPKRSNYAVVMSRICPEKGVHLAIDATERAHIELLIAGSLFEYKEHREYFDSAIQPRLNGRVRFIGPVGGARKADLLAGARCVLVPSLAPETSSLVAMEAMAAGTPVIAFRSGALPEIVRHERTGFLVNNVEEMVEAIREVHAIQAEACRREAKQRFSSKKMLAEYLNLYDSVVNGAKTEELQVA